MFGGRVQPVIATAPDCPIGFLRAPDGRFVAYHRMAGYGRRVFRSESWDFAHWSGEPQMVLEPDAGDSPQTQFYGLGACAYGPYELGTLWMYATDPDDRGPSKSQGLQTPELAYARAGTAWHRAEPGTAFIPNGAAGEWDCGNLQPASQPVFLDDEIRYYYAGTSVRHSRHWELEPQEAGLGLARLKPDRFVALRAGQAPAELGTIAFKPPSVDVFVNARTAADGEVRVELQDVEARPLPGFSTADCRPIRGDATAQRVEWRGIGQAEAPVGQPTRIRLTARQASRVLGVRDRTRRVAGLPPVRSASAREPGLVGGCMHRARPAVGRQQSSEDPGTAARDGNCRTARGVPMAQEWCR